MQEWARGDETVGGIGWERSRVRLELRDDRTKEVCCSARGVSRTQIGHGTKKSRVNRTNGWKEKRFERGEPNFRGKLAEAYTGKKMIEWENQSDRASSHIGTQSKVPAEKDPQTRMIDFSGDSKEKEILSKPGPLASLGGGG